MDTSPTTLPAHIEETVDAIAKLHADHLRAASPLQRIAGRSVDLLGRPAFIGFLLAGIACWIAGNYLAPAFGHLAIDPPPFVWLELSVSVAALCATVLILATQRRDDQLAQHREQMTLELAILSEQKLAKVIDLLEESRRDNPMIGDRVDKAAEALAMPVDPQSLADAVKQRHANAEKPSSAEDGVKVASEIPPPKCP